MRYLLLLIVIVLSACSHVTETLPSAAPVHPALSYDKAVYAQTDMLPGSATLSAACPGDKLIYDQVVTIHVDGIVHIVVGAKLIGGLSGDDELDRDHKLTMVDVYHNLVRGTINRPRRSLTVPQLPPGDYWIVGMAQGVAHPYTKASTYRLEVTIPEGCPVA